VEVEEALFLLQSVGRRGRRCPPYHPHRLLRSALADHAPCERVPRGPRGRRRMLRRDASNFCCCCHHGSCSCCCCCCCCCSRWPGREGGSRALRHGQCCEARRAGASPGSPFQKRILGPGGQCAHMRPCSQNSVLIPLAADCRSGEDHCSDISIHHGEVQRHQLTS